LDGEVTTLSHAKPGSRSLRTAVPSGIVHHLNLKKGDKLRWSLEVRDNKLVIVVIPEQNPEKDKGGEIA